MEEQFTKIKPAFELNNIAVVFQSSDYYAPYTAVVIQSIMDTSTNGNNYDIIVTTLDMSDHNKKVIEEMSIGYSNISVRVINVFEYRKQYPLYNSERFVGQETWTRIFLPDLLKYYDKVIDLDSDMVVVSDIAEIYAMDITNYYMAGVYDSLMNYTFYTKASNGFIVKYITDNLEFKNAETYINAGFILFNLQKIREEITVQKIYKYANERQFRFLEQDTLNKIFYGKIAYLSSEWNYYVSVLNKEKYVRAKVPDHVFSDFDKVNGNFKIIHFLDKIKPWDDPTIHLANHFWKYARVSPLYETILFRMMQVSTKRIEHRLKILEDSFSKYDKCMATSDCNKKTSFINQLLPKGTKRREFVKMIIKPIREIRGNI